MILAITQILKPSLSHSGFITDLDLPFRFLHAPNRSAAAGKEVKID